MAYGDFIVVVSWNRIEAKLMLCRWTRFYWLNQILTDFVRLEMLDDEKTTSKTQLIRVSLMKDDLDAIFKVVETKISNQMFKKTEKFRFSSKENFVLRFLIEVIFSHLRKRWKKNANEVQNELTLKRFFLFFFFFSGSSMFIGTKWTFSMFSNEWSSSYGFSKTRSLSTFAFTKNWYDFVQSDRRKWNRRKTNFVSFSYVFFSFD